MPSPAEPVAEPAPEVSEDRPVAQRRSRRLLLGGLAVLGIGVVVVALTVNVATPNEPVRTPIVGRAAPAFDLETLDGQRIRLADLRGSAIVLNFWASWCIPCREEAPVLTAADRNYRLRGLRVLGVVYQDSATSARDFMTRYGQTYPGLLDPDGRTAIDYGVFGIPETFFIDPDGVVRARQVGVIRADEIDRQVEAMLP